MQSLWEVGEPLDTPGFAPCRADCTCNQELTVHTLPVAPGSGKTRGPALRHPQGRGSFQLSHHLLRGLPPGLRGQARGHPSAFRGCFCFFPTADEVGDRSVLHAHG